MSYPFISKAGAAADSNPVAYDPTEPICPAVSEGSDTGTTFLQETPAAKPSQPFQNQCSFRLFSPNCPLWSNPVSDIGPLALDDIPVDQTVPLATFDLNDADQHCMAERLGAFLDGLSFDNLNQKIHGKDYGHKPIFDTDLSAADIRRRFAAFPEFGKNQQNALLFFMYGEALTEGEINDLFRGHAELFEAMKGQNLFVAETRGAGTVYRLNGLSLTSQRLPNQKTLYLFNDLPPRLNGQSSLGEPTAQISETSYFLLNRLMGDYQRGVKRSGVMADFGAGTGIQALALLKMYPGITEAISLEIDGHSMNLNRFNAMLNGMGDRVQVVDNMQPENFTAALAGRELDFAVSNPPFNIVPHEYENSFTHFGYGGDHGIDITKIFLDQAMPVLKKGGEFLYYSYLARDQKGDFFVTQYLRDHFKGLTLYYDNLDARGYRYFDRPGYAKALANFMVEHGLTGEGPHDAALLARDIEAKLKERGVIELDEKIGRIVKRGDARPVTVDKNAISRPLEPLAHLKALEGMLHGGERAEMLGGERITRLFDERTLREIRGGVYEMLQEAPKIQGGERFERRGGVYLQVHQVPKIDAARIRELLKGHCKGDPECEKLLSDPDKTKK